MENPLIDIAQIWVTKSSWGDVDGIHETSDYEKLKWVVTGVEEDIISFKILKTDKSKDYPYVNKIHTHTTKEFLEEFRQYPFVDITPEEVIARLDQTVSNPDYPYGSKKHLESLIAIQVQIQTNDNKPLYFIGFDNGKDFVIPSVYWRDLDFIMKHFSDGSMKPNVNRLNKDHIEKMKEKDLHIKYRRPMWFKPHKVAIKEIFDENGKFIPTDKRFRFIDWDSNEGDKVNKNSQILDIWAWENKLGLYKIYRLTTPEKIEIF